MVIVKTISGLGNQLFQYAVGRHLSIIHNVPLKLDISFFQSSDTPYAFDQLTRSFKLGHYNINATIADKNEIKSYIGRYLKKNFMSKLYLKAAKIVPRYKRRYFEEMEWWTYDKDLSKVTSKVYLNGYWQHYKYFQNLSPNILEELTLKEDYISIYKKDIEENKNSVSLHIRRGDYVNDGLFTVQSIDYYKSAIDIIVKKIKSPTFYIFSDDLNWAKDNANFHAETIFVEGQADYIDLDLMRRCRHNIIANSSFSWWGAMLNKNVEKIVIAPSQWVIPEDINKRVELAFPNWIKI